MKTLILFEKIKIFSVGFCIFISNILYYILDIPKMLRDNHETTVIRETTPKKDIKEH